MKKNLATALLILVILISFPSCKRDEQVSTPDDSTVAPVVPVSSTTGTDGELTQTVEISEERSPNEGGILTSTIQSESQQPASGTTPATATTATTSAPR